MLTKVAIKQLVFDNNIYPRDKINPFHVSELASVLQAGFTLPPPVADSKTFKVIDGFHTINAHLKLYGESYEIETELKNYANDAEMFAEAIQRNVAHGQSLSHYDKAQALIKAEELGMELTEISSLFQMTPEKVQEMKASRFASYQMKPIALKYSVAHFANKELTKKQVRYINTAGGLSQSYYINQVIAMIKSDAINWADTSVSVAFTKLLELINTVKVPVAE